MTIQWGDTGRISVGTLKTLSITPYVNEQNLTSTALYSSSNAATSVPTGMTPTVSFTVNASTMVPSFSGVNVLSYKPIYGLNVAGQNTNGSSQTVYYNIYKNGSTYKNGSSSIVNNNYWTVSLQDGSLNNGDKLDFYIWTPATSGVNYFYQNIFTIPGRVDTGAKNMVNASFTIVSLGSNTYFPLNPNKAGVNYAPSVYVYPSNAGNRQLSISGAETDIFPLFASHPTYKLYQTQGGDVAVNCSIGSSTTSYPYMQVNWFVSQIQYRDLFF